MRYWIGCLLLISGLFPASAFAQGDYNPPRISAKVQKDFDAIVLSSKAGHTEESIQGLQQIIARFPTWTAPRHELSRIYFEAGKLNESVAALEESIALDTSSQIKQLYTLARLYEQTNQPEKSKATYITFVQKAAPADPLRDKARETLELFAAREVMMERKYDIDLVPLPAEINSENHESVGRWTLDGRELFFARLVNGQEDLFIASRDSATQQWSVKAFPYNTSDNEGAPAISPDGKYLVFTSCNRPDSYGGCDLYVSLRKNGQWTKPVNMGPGFNSPAWDGQPCFGLDGVTFYFSSNRDGGFGGRDIWYMYQIAGDSWSKPISAGPGINTPNNEGSPFIYFDGNTMYFMRDGKETLGGSDLFISRKGLDGKWQKAENMGPPINSMQSEGALAVHPNGKRAILTRLTSEQKNDLFEFDLPQDFISMPQQALHVSFRDKLTGAPLRGQLEIFEARGNPETRLSQWSNEDGQIVATLQRNTPYGVIANTVGYMMYSANLDPDTSATRYLEIDMIPMSNVVNEAIVLQNIFFETGSAEILPPSEPELQKLLYTLKTNQAMVIEIHGHTDNVGDETFNQTLSEARAKAVYTWLLDKGIPATRLAYKGFGETQPVASNDTESGRKQNRRTEFLIIQN